MQLVGYEKRTKTDEGAVAALLVADGGGLTRRLLSPGDELAYALGARHCAGTIDGDTHIACADDAAPYCDQHANTWVCARCTGTCLKAEMDCHEDHAVYLAAFPPATFKVGVTREWRLETRLREQGAVRAAHLRTVADGRIARRIEADIAADVPDRVRVPTKIAGLHREVDSTAWEALLAEFDPVETFAFDYGLDIDTQPVHETLASGTVVGTQGRVLLLENGGTTYAVDMRDLVGHELTDGKPDRSLQSSLGTFG